jgi:hypothetical protein
LGNKKIRTAVIVVMSLIAAVLLFLLVTYSGLGEKYLHVTMPLFGLNPNEEGGDERYFVWFILGLLALLFITSFIVLNRFLFRKRK